MLTVVAVALLLLAGAQLAPPTSARAGTTCPADATPGAVGEKTVVLLVHGFESSMQTWTTGSPSMASSLGALPNVHVAAFDYSSVADRWVTNPKIGPALAQVIKCYADASAAHGTGKVVLVGHSMGGLAIRCALAQSCGGVVGNDGRVGDVITLGTPNTGSFWQFHHSAVAQKASLGTLGAICLGLSFDEIRQNQGLNDVCTFLHHAADSEAAQAFQQGSPQLKALPPMPSGIPVHGIAGDARLGAEEFFYHDDPMDAGDLVVGVDSAQAVSVDKPKVTIDCGNWYLQFVHPSVEVWKSLAWVQSGTCWHSSETSNPDFVRAVTGLVSDYVTVHGCGGSVNDPAVLAAVKKVPSAGYPWSTDPRDYWGNFDRCADLSAVGLPIDGATGSSPVQVLLFHKGVYVGTATHDAYRSPTLDAKNSSSDTVAVGWWYSRRWDPDEASVSGRAAVKLHWDGQKVQMIGSLPDDLTKPQADVHDPLVSLDGYGPAFSWGTTQSAAEAALGGGAKFEASGGGSCEQAQLAGYGLTTFGIADGKVVVVAIGDSPNSIGVEATADTGIQLGDPVTKVQRAYPGLVVGPDPSDAYSTRYTYTKNGRTAQFVSSGDGKVDSMQFGVSDFVGEWPCV